MKKEDHGPIGHHTVPQTGLKFFSPDEANIYRFDKVLNVSKFLPVDSISKRNNYYSFTEPNGKKNSLVETEFTALIDGKYNKLVENLNNKVPLETIKDDIVEQFSSQFGRVEKQRNNIDRVLCDLKIDDLDARQSLVGMFAMIDVHSSVMQKSEFWIGKAVGRARFITSDNPAGRGFFPLTPTLCIVSSNKKDRHEYVDLTDEVVTQFNKITFDNAKRYIYSLEEFETRVPV